MILSDELKTIRAQALVDKIDFSVATLNLLNSGGDVVVSLPFARPNCALDVTEGVVSFATLPETMALLTGEAFKADIVDDKGDFIAHVSVSDENGNGEIKFKRLQFFAGDLVRIKNWVHTEQ